tara:strand:- start:881 stop:10396 length:9516 start_codon:yes stop_codon:yes gene_type:complete
MPIIPNNVTSILDEYFEQNPVKETEEEIVEEVQDQPVDTDVVETEIEEHPMQQQWNSIMEGAVKDPEVEKSLPIYGQQIDLGWKNMSFTMPTYVETVFDDENQLFIVENLPEDKKEEAEQFNLQMKQQQELIAKQQEEWNKFTAKGGPGEIILSEDENTEYMWNLIDDEPYVEYSARTKGEEDWRALSIDDENQEDIIGALTSFGHIDEGDITTTTRYNLSKDKINRTQQYVQLGWAPDDTVDKDLYDRLTFKKEPNFASDKIIEVNKEYNLVDGKMNFPGINKDYIKDVIAAEDLDNPFPYTYYYVNNEKKNSIDTFFDTFYPNLFKELEKENEEEYKRRVADFKGWLAKDDIPEDLRELVKISDLMGPFGEFSNEGWDLLDIAFQNAASSTPMGNSITQMRGLLTSALNIYLNENDESPIVDQIKKALNIFQGSDGSGEEGDIALGMQLSSYVENYMADVNTRLNKAVKLNDLLGRDELPDELKSKTETVTEWDLGETKFDPKTMTTKEVTTEYTIDEALKELKVDKEGKPLGPYSYFSGNDWRAYQAENYPAYFNKLEDIALKRQEKKLRQQQTGTSILDGLGDVIYNFPAAIRQDLRDIPLTVTGWIAEAAGWAEKKITGDDFSYIQGVSKGMQRKEDVKVELEKQLRDYGGYGIITGKAFNYNGVRFIRDDQGIVYDADSNFMVGPDDFPATLDEETGEIIDPWKEITKGLDESTETVADFSLRGAAATTSTVFGHLATQILLTRGVGLLTAPARASLLARLNGFKNVSQFKVAEQFAKQANKLNPKAPPINYYKLPIKQYMVDAIIAQGMYFSQIGYNDVRRQGTKAGMNSNEVEALAQQASLLYAGIGMITAPIAPLAKWNQAATNSLRAAATKNSILGTLGRGSFIDNVKNVGLRPALTTLGNNLKNWGFKQLPKTQMFLYEGGRETVQEIIQEVSTTYGVGSRLNKKVNRERAPFKEAMTGDEILNLGMQAFIAGGLGSRITNPNAYASYTNLESLYLAGLDPEGTNKFLDTQVKNKTISLEQKQQILNDIAAVKRTAGKIPKWVSSDKQLEVMRLQDKIDTLKRNKKEAASDYYVELLDKQIKGAEAEMRNLLEPDVIKLFSKINVGVEKIAGDIGQKFFSGTLSEIEQKIEEIQKANPGRKINVDKSSATDYGVFVTVDAVVDDNGSIIQEEENYLLVNEDEALKDRMFATGQHEGFHGLVRAFVKKYKADMLAWEQGGRKGKKPENVVSKLAVSLLNELRNNKNIIFNNTEAGRELQARIEQYVLDENVDPEVALEEIMTLFSEALTYGDVEVDVGFIGKLQDIFRRFFNYFGANVTIKDGNDVVNLIRDYNRLVEKGKGAKGFLGKDSGIMKFAKGEADIKLGEVDVETEIETIGKKRIKQKLENIQKDRAKSKRKPKGKKSKKLDLDTATTSWQKGEDIDIENVIIPQLEAAVISALDRWGVTGGRNVNPDTWRRKDVMKELKQEVGKELWSFMENFDRSKSSATTYSNNLALRIGPRLIEMFATKGRSLDKMQEEKGFTPQTVETKDFDENQDEDLGRPLIYPTEIDAISGEIEALVEPMINKIVDKLVGKGGFFPSIVGKRAGDIYTRMGNKTANQKKKANQRITPTPEQLVKYLINYATKSTDVRADIKSIIGKYSDAQYEEFVKRAVRGGLIKAIPIKTIKRRFKNVKGFELKKTFRQDNVQYYEVPRVSENALIDYLVGPEVSGDNIKGRDKRYNSFVSMLAEGIMVETLGNLKNNSTFMRRLGDLLEINNSPLTAQEFITEVENLLDARTVEKASLDNVKASKKLNKETMEELGQSKDINKTKRILNIPNLNINNYTSNTSNVDLEKAYKKLVKIQETLEDNVSTYNITANTLNGASMTNFGALAKYTEGSQDLKKQGVKGFKKSYAVINTNTGKLRWVEVKPVKVETKNGKIKIRWEQTGDIMKDPKRFNPTRDTFLPASKGKDAIYWGTNDPAYQRLRKLAQVNTKLLNRSRPRNSQVKLPAGKVITAKWFNAKVRNTTNEKRMNNNMDVLEEAVLELEAAHANGMGMEYITLFITGAYQATSGMIKTAAPFLYVHTDLKPGEQFREEHNPPASVIGSYLLYGIQQNEAATMMDIVRKVFHQSQIPISVDNMLNVEFKETIPKGTTLENGGDVRIIDAGIDLNKLRNPKSKQTLADVLKLPLKPGDRNADSVNEQRNIARKTLVADENGKLLSPTEGRKELRASKKVNSDSAKQVNNNKDNLLPLIKRNSSTEESIEVMSNADKAQIEGKKYEKPKKGISVFDFDDTIAYSKSKVIVNMGDQTFEITPAEFARTAEDLEAQGATFNFDQFNKVIDGRKGPLADLALKRQGKFGSGDIFILTARPQASAEAIHTFLNGIGLEIPIENITGLENGSPEAKALWILEKTAQGYNDFYFADDSLPNVQAVKNILDQVDVKSKVQQAKASKKIDLDKDFNVIIEQQSGKEWYKTYSRARAQVEGKASNKFEFFIPPSAEDFLGLMYKIVPKGKDGDRALAWIQDNLVDPFNKAEQAIITAQIAVANDFQALRDGLDNIPSNLQDQSGFSNFTWSQALRVYIWNMQGMDIPGLSARDRNGLIKLIESNPDMKVFAEKIAFIQKESKYPKPDNNWVAGSITGDIINSIQKTYRGEALQEWQQNVDIIFSEKNMNKLEAIYGSNFVRALRDILGRMKRGSNRAISDNPQVDNVVDWLNNSVGTVMFLNRKSALLQLISNVNFLNWSDNNIIAAGKAFANQPQYWKDVMYLMNSDYLVQRRNGMKINVAESEIAEASKKGGFKGVVSYLLNKGFIFTRIADSLAIATGGATFYRNRKNRLLKEINTDTGKLYTEAEAEAIAFNDFYKVSEESQQSSRTDRISMQQASGLGRLVLNFANTPMQYARIIKKSTADLLAGRGDWRTNVSKILYYGLVQNLIFNGLQQALFASAFDEEDKDKRDLESKTYDIGFGMLSSLLRGLGYGGALVDTLIAVGREINNQSNKKSPDYEEAVWNVFDFSPSIDSKVRKLRSASNTPKYNREEIKRRGWSLENPAYLMAGQIVSATVNVPLDNALRMAMSVKQASDRDTATWQRLGLVFGWSSWQLNLPYWGTTSTIETERLEDEAIKKKYDDDARKLKTQGFKRIPMTRGKPDGVLIEDYIEVTRPNGKIEYWLTPKE